MNEGSQPGRSADAELVELLARGAAALSLRLQTAQVECLVRFVRLIAKWNVTYNLTAVRDPRDMVTHHLLDCLAAAAALLKRRGQAVERLLDVGSGAGLPGVVIAVVSPDREVVCVDSVGKKAAFITQVAGELGLKNVTARHQRVENLQDQPFDVVASRAFASLTAFVTDTRPLLAANGVWMAMKGKPPDAEVRQLQGISFHVEPLSVPGLDAERCIVWLAPSTDDVSANL
ncbi:MAG: 16S rRNA (guanine(527)-N(7))-methyltransferase RsmG [Caldimonas sp.]